MCLKSFHLSHLTASRGSDDAADRRKQARSRQLFWRHVMNRDPGEICQSRLLQHTSSIANLHQKRNRAADCHCKSGIYPPQRPCHRRCPTTPCRDADQDDHVHDSRKTHWETTQEQRMRRMVDHCRPQLRPQGIPQDGYEQSANED